MENKKSWVPFLVGAVWLASAFNWVKDNFEKERMILHYCLSSLIVIILLIYGYNVNCLEILYMAYGGIQRFLFCTSMIFLLMDIVGPFFGFLSYGGLIAASISIIFAIFSISWSILGFMWAIAIVGFYILGLRKIWSFYFLRTNEWEMSHYKFEDTIFYIGIFMMIIGFSLRSFTPPPPEEPDSFALAYNKEKNIKWEITFEMIDRDYFLKTGNSLATYEPIKKVFQGSHDDAMLYAEKVQSEINSNKDYEFMADSWSIFIYDAPWQTLLKHGEVDLAKRFIREGKGK